MILNIVIFKNNNLECFTTPQFDDHEVDVIATQLKRSIQATCKDGKESQIKHLKGLTLFSIGKFNDVTGELETWNPVKLLDCDDYFQGDENA